jgi:hypothetical protein
MIKTDRLKAELQTFYLTTLVAKEYATGRHLFDGL